MPSSYMQPRYHCACASPWLAASRAARKGANLINFIPLRIVRKYAAGLANEFGSVLTDIFKFIAVPQSPKRRVVVCGSWPWSRSWEAYGNRRRSGWQRLLNARAHARAAAWSGPGFKGEPRASTEHVIFAIYFLP
jgi:hypothetical protein